MADKNVVLINVICAANATYLNDPDNIGHEFINFMSDDNGDNYVYVLPYGTYDYNKYSTCEIARKQKITAVLNVKRINSKTLIVLSKATELTEIVDEQNNVIKGRERQNQYINKIQYGGKTLKEIFNDQNVTDKRTANYITFKAKKIEVPKTPIILKEKDFFKELQKHFPKQSPKMYIPEKIFNTIQEKKSWKWESKTLPQLNNDYYKNFTDLHRKRNFVHILGKDYDELAYSNMLKYLFENNKEDFVKFLNCIFYDRVKLQDGSFRDFKIETEVAFPEKDEEEHFKKCPRIDILITDTTDESKHNVVVIENKILSGENNDQLNKYTTVINTKYSGYTSYFLLLVPKYAKTTTFNEETLKKIEERGYTIITYQDIYDCFKNVEKDDKITKDILEALSWHAKDVNNFQEEQMFARLFERIKTIK